MERDKRVERIVKSLTSRAFDFARLDLPHDEFFSKWIDMVSKDTGYDLDTVKDFHHPVWWHLTLSSGSPIEYYQPTAAARNGSMHVKIRNPSSLAPINQYIEEIFRENGSWYQSRANRIPEAA